MSLFCSYPDFNKPFNLITNSRNFAIGQIFSQGSVRSETFRTVKESELKYSTIAIEMLATVYLTKYFRRFNLFDSKIIENIAFNL